MRSEQKKPAKRSLSAVHLGFLLFFLTAGGPFGIEPSVYGAGCLMAIVGSTAIALFWAYPQAVLATELGLMIDSNGGGFVWVHRAWGPFVGWINGWNGMASSFINIGLLISLFPRYFPVDTSQWSMWSVFGVGSAFTLITIAINIVGFRWVSRVSGLIMIILFSPFVALFVWEVATGRVHTMPWNALGEIPPWSYVSVRMATYIGNTVWAFGGFDSLGSIAGEIEGGKRTFFLGLLFCMPMMLLNYALPLTVTYPLYTNYSAWGMENDQIDLVDVFQMETTQWLWIMAVIGAISATFAQLSSSIMSFSRVIWAASKSTGRYKHYPRFVSISWQRHTGTIRPVVAVLFVGIVGALLTLIEFNIIQQLYLVSRIINLLCLYSSLIRLRFLEPDAPRPFKIPGGIPALVALALPTVIISGVALAFADPIVWIVSGVAEAVIILGYFGRALWLRYFPEEDMLVGEPPEKGNKVLKVPVGENVQETAALLVADENQRSFPTYFTGSIQTYDQILTPQKQDEQQEQ